MKDLISPQNHKTLQSILTDRDYKNFISLKEELLDNFKKKQIWRTEHEMRISVLNDGRHPTRAAKYWQCVREQDVFFTNLMNLSFKARRNDVKIKKIKKQMEETDDPFILEGLQISLDEKFFNKATMELEAKDRMRELSKWSKLKKEFNDGSFDTKNIEVSQEEGLRKFLNNRAKPLSTSSNSDDVFNVFTQLATHDRLLEERLYKIEQAKKVEENKKLNGS